jgi:hypothetical protein
MSDIFPSITKKPFGIGVANLLHKRTKQTDIIRNEASLHFPAQEVAEHPAEVIVT